MAYIFEKTEIPDVVIIKPKVYLDKRGFFIETYKFTEFYASGIREKFVQDNHSQSVRNVLRGLHYQKNPKAQGKLIRVIHGEIFDVAVDIRKGSATFGHWAGINLSADNKHMLYIPPGFAHGLCVISDTAEVFYKVTEEYSPEQEGGILWNDPDISIRWPIKNPILSEKDTKYPFLKDIEANFVY